MSKWVTKTLGQLATRLVNGGTPPTDVAQFWNGNIPWITGADFTDAGIGEFRRFVSPLAVAGTATNVVSHGELLIVTRTGVGKLAIAPCDIAISQDITGVYVDRAQVAPEFLFHRMQLGMQDLRKLNQGTSINGVVRDDLVGYPIMLPPLPQQRRIAEILGTVDETIEATEALIEKQQQVKAGLMHDLFTRGLTPDGNIRPPPSAAPALYHQTPLGLLPKEWRQLKCSEVCEKNTVGIVVRPTQYYVSEGVPAFRSANVREEGIDPSDLVFISKEANDLLCKSQVRAGDVISVRTGYPGTTAVVPAEFEGANCIDILISRPSQLLLPHFMAAWINSSFGKDQVLRKQGGLAQQHFNVGDLRELKFVVPELGEQKAIIDRLSALNATLAAETARLAKLRQQKQGLMQALLTPPGATSG